MTLPFAINGLGRVGRALLRASWRRGEMRLVAINDPAPVEQLARLLARDTVHGGFAEAVAARQGALEIDGRRVPVFAEREPARVPWGETGARVVVEASGALRSGSAAAAHLGGGVERVVVAWNADDVDVTLCLGLNEAEYDPARHRVISNASCTTNCVAPMVKVLHDAFGVERALVNTVHSVTNNQVLLDRPHPDPRRARSALVNIIPTPSQAGPAVGKVLPEMAGKIEGYAVRVPAPDVALLDLAAHLARPATAEQARAAFRRAAEGELAGILGVTEEELVSSDFIGDPRSAVVDLPLLQVADGRLLRAVAWYDNEWGYAHRLADLLALLASREP